MRRGDFGDLYVQVKTEVPVYLNKKQKELLEQFREIENDKSNPSIKKFFQKAKDFWKKQIIKANLIFNYIRSMHLLFGLIQLVALI